MEYIQGNKGVFTITCEPGKQYRVLTASSESLPFGNGQPVVLRPLNSNYSPFPYDYKWQSNDLILSLNYNAKYIAIETIETKDTETFLGTLNKHYINASGISKVVVKGFTGTGNVTHQILSVMIKTPVINGTLCKTNPADISAAQEYFVHAVTNKNGVEFSINNSIKCTPEDDRLTFMCPLILEVYR